MALNPSSGTADTPLSALAVMQDAPVIPVIVIRELADAVPIARALVAGGIRMLEVTLRTPVALEAIAAIATELPDAVVGAGTLRSADDVAQAVRAGARFGVSPGYTRPIGEACRNLGLPLLPGVATSAEIMQAMDDGHRELKFFPALQAGGIGLLKAWQGPFAEVRFCPTGGIDLRNAGDFLALANVVCVGGSWLVPQDAVTARDWPRIETLAREATALGR